MIKYNEEQIQRMKDENMVEEYREYGDLLSSVSSSISDKHGNFKKSIMNFLSSMFDEGDDGYSKLMYFYDYIVNNWHNDTLMYLKHKQLSNKQIESYKNSKNMERFSFDRSMENYLNRLIQGWITEDYVRLFILDYKATGSDLNRQILLGDMFKGVGSELDGMAKSKNGKNIPIDIVSDWTGYCSKNSSISLMFEKITKMQNQNAFLIILDISNRNVLLLDTKNDVVNKEKVIITPAARTKTKRDIYKYEVSFNYNNIFDKGYTLKNKQLGKYHKLG